MDKVTLLVYAGLLIVVLLISLAIFFIIRRTLTRIVGFINNKGAFESYSPNPNDPGELTIVSLSSLDETQYSTSNSPLLSIHTPDDERFRPHKRVVNLDGVHSRTGRTIRDCGCERCMKIKREMNDDK